MANHCAALSDPSGTINLQASVSAHWCGLLLRIRWMSAGTRRIRLTDRPHFSAHTFFYLPVNRHVTSSSASFSPASGMWAAMKTNPTTDGSMPASVLRVSRSFITKGYLRSPRRN